MLYAGRRSIILVAVVIGAASLLLTGCPGGGATVHNGTYVKDMGPDNTDCYVYGNEICVYNDQAGQGTAGRYEFTALQDDYFSNNYWDPTWEGTVNDSVDYVVNRTNNFVVFYTAPQQQTDQGFADAYGAPFVACLSPGKWMNLPAGFVADPLGNVTSSYKQYDLATFSRLYINCRLYANWDNKIYEYYRPGTPAG